MKTYHFALTQSITPNRTVRWADLTFPLETHYTLSYARGYQRHVLSVFFDSATDEAAFIDELRRLVRDYENRELHDAGGAAASPT